MNLYSLSKKAMFYSIAALVRKLLFLPRENNIYIFKPQCNIPDIDNILLHICENISR